MKEKVLGSLCDQGYRCKLNIPFMSMECHLKLSITFIKGYKAGF